jgi:hypothetical protein
VSLAKKPSTALSQDAEGRGEVERPAGMPRKLSARYYGANAHKGAVPVANLIRLALIENRTMLLCDHLCRLIGWMVSDLVRSRATLEAEIWTLLQK